jgi:hypothetical protein
LTFDEFRSADFETTFKGNEVVGLYLALSRDEEGLDLNQRKTLESLRAVLYENLSIEELEDIASVYSSRLAERSVP